VKLVACQIQTPDTRSADERDAHVGRLATLVDRYLTENSGDLVVLPELSTIDYSEAAFQNLDVLAEDLNGPSVEQFASVAKSHGVTIAFGMPLRNGANICISQVVIGSDGSVAGHYDKLHTAQFGDSMEAPYFARGDHLMVFQVDDVRIAPIICYDFRFPELTRRLAFEQDVQVILHPVAFSKDSTFPSWHHFAVARAMENQVFFLSLNRAGPRYGQSIFCPPWIDEARSPVKFGESEEIKTFDIDLSLLQDARQEFSFRGDHLGGYGDLPVLGSARGS